MISNTFYCVSTFGNILQNKYLNQIERDPDPAKASHTHSLSLRAVIELLKHLPNLAYEADLLMQVAKPRIITEYDRLRVSG